MAGQNPCFMQSSLTTLAATTSSVAASLPLYGETAAVTNTSAALAWVAFGPTATIGRGYPVMPGSLRMIALLGPVTQVSVILAAGTGAVYVERGNGR